MTFGRAVLMLTVSIGTFCGIASAQVDGVWNFTNNACSGDVQLTISTWEDGSPVGKISGRGFEDSIYNVRVLGNHISFSIDRQDHYSVVTDDYDATVSGNNMDGTCKTEEVPPRTGRFTARRGVTTAALP